MNLLHKRLRRFILGSKHTVRESYLFMKLSGGIGLDQQPMLNITLRKSGTSTVEI